MAERDIVERLLAEGVQASDDELGELVDEAAAEIERLRAEVKVLHDVLPLPPGHHHVTVRADGGWDAAPMEEQTFAPRMWEYVARCFHAHYERLASDFGYETRPESAVAWQNVPERNRQLMVATVGHVLRDIRDTGRLWVDAPEQGDDRG